MATRSSAGGGAGGGWEGAGSGRRRGGRGGGARGRGGGWRGGGAGGGERAGGGGRAEGEALDRQISDEESPGTKGQAGGTGSAAPPLGVSAEAMAVLIGDLLGEADGEQACRERLALAELDRQVQRRGGRGRVRQEREQ